MSTSNGSAQVTRERDSLRRFIRIRMPAMVVIDRHSHPVTDWSLGGLAIEDVDRPLTAGDCLKAELVVPFGDFNFTTDVVLEVVRVDTGARRIGCRFVDLRAEQMPFLRYVVESHLAGRAPTADGLVGTSASQRPPTGAQLTPGAGPPAQTRARRLMRSLVRATVLVVLGAALAALVAALVYTHVLTVEAETAAVVGEAVEVRAPADGAITGPRLKPGARVKSGDILFAVRSDAVVHELDAAVADVALEERKLATLLEALGERERVFAGYQVVADADVRKADAERERSQTALALAHRRLERMTELFRRSLVAAQDLDNERNAVAAVAVAEMEHRRAESTLVQATSNARMAAEGHLLSGARVDGLEPGEIRRQIAVARKTVDVARARAKGLRQLLDRQTQATVRSPCDCVVHAAAASPGEWVAKAQPVYTLERTAESGIVIEALVDQETASAIPIGARADIALADRADLVRGVVVAVNRTSADVKRAGLALPPAAGEQRARVLVAPIAALRDVPAGLPVRVKFAVRAWLPFWGARAWSARDTNTRIATDGTTPSPNALPRMAKGGLPR